MNARRRNVNAPWEGFPGFKQTVDIDDLGTTSAFPIDQLDGLNRYGFRAVVGDSEIQAASRQNQAVIYLDITSGIKGRHSR